MAGEIIRNSRPHRSWFFFAFGAVLLAASPAHAQRVPEIVLWSASASLLAPFVAIPVKLGIVRLLALDVPAPRWGSIAAMEWVLWFPAAVVLLRSGRSSEVPMTVVALFFAAVWIHKWRLPELRWSSALYLTLPTLILAILLPLVALGVAAFLESVAR